MRHNAQQSAATAVPLGRGGASPLHPVGAGPARPALCLVLTRSVVSRKFPATTDTRFATSRRLTTCRRTPPGSESRSRYLTYVSMGEGTGRMASLVQLRG